MGNSLATHKRLDKDEKEAETPNGNFKEEEEAETSNANSKEEGDEHGLICKFAKACANRKSYFSSPKVETYQVRYSKLKDSASVEEESKTSLNSEHSVKKCPHQNPNHPYEFSDKLGPSDQFLYKNVKCRYCELEETVPVHNSPVVIGNRNQSLNENRRTSIAYRRSATSDGDNNSKCYSSLSVLYEQIMGSFSTNELRSNVKQLAGVFSKTNYNSFDLFDMMRRYPIPSSIRFFRLTEKSRLPRVSAKYKPCFIYRNTNTAKLSTIHEVEGC